MHVGPEKVFYGSGVELVKFPKGGRVLSVSLNNRTHDGMCVCVGGGVDWG